MSTAGQEGTVAAEQTETPATPAAETPTETQTAAETTPETTETAAETPAAPEFDQAKFEATMAENEDLKRTVARISKQRTADHEARQVEPAPEQPARPLAAQEPTTPGVDPALASLESEVGDDGKRWYKLDGMLVTPEFAKRMLARDVGDRVGVLEADREERANKEAAAEAVAHYTRAMDVAGASIKEGCKVAFPGLEGEALDSTAQTITQLTADAVDAAVEGGEELTHTLVAKTAAKIMAAERNRVSQLIAAQTKDNTEYGDANKVKSGGVAAITPPKPLDQMTRQERRKFTRRLAENARARSEAES